MCPDRQLNGPRPKIRGSQYFQKQVLNHIDLVPVTDAEAYERRIDRDQRDKVRFGNTQSKSGLRYLPADTPVDD